MKSTLNSMLKHCNFKAIIYILGIVLGIIPVTLQGQVQIQLRPFSPFHFTPEHSWELDIINLNEKSFRVFMKSKIYGKDYHLLAELESEVVMLNKGINSFNSMTTQTNKLSYKEGYLGSFVQAVGKFPPGEYFVCITLFCVTPDCDGAGNTALMAEPQLCREVVVEEPTPLLLAYPLNKSEIEVTRPMFTWIPPMPIAGMVELRYIYNLVEKREGQSNIDAIKRNRPLIRDEYVANTSLMYPFDVEELEYEKDYAWQVEAWYGDFYIATSEIWEFKLKTEIEEKDTFKYAKLSTNPTTSFYSVKKNSVFCFAHDGLYSNTELKVVILDDLNKPLESSPSILKTEIFRPDEDTLVLSSYGNNKFSIDLKQFNLNIGSYYNVKVIEGADKLYYLRIYIIENK